MGAFLMPNPDTGATIMADEATPATPDPGTPDTGDQAPDITADRDKWKAMSRQHEARAKENAAAATKLAAIEEAQKSDAQKAADKMAEVEKRATTAELKALRLEVALAKGVPADYQEFLTGDTLEELEAKADKLLALGTREGPGTGTPPSGRPKEALRAGASAEAVTADGNQAINDRIRQAARR